MSFEKTWYHSLSSPELKKLRSGAWFRRLHSGRKESKTFIAGTEMKKS